MIKINLLGVPKPKRGKRGGVGGTTSMPSMSGEGPNPIVIGAIAALIGFGAFGYTWYSASDISQKLEKRMQAAEQENRRLADVKAKFLEAQKQADLYKKRVDVIDQLRKTQAGPLNLLTMIGDTVNGTDAVWLEKMNDAGSTIKLEGQALSANAVANLVKNLQKTGYFKTVELDESLQDNQNKEMQAFIFKLTCEKPIEKAPEMQPAAKKS